MRNNFEKALPAILKHEGGYVNHPKDPGGATNKGITIGTLKRLGIDVDGDGDSDIADLKGLRHEHVARVYKLFYWDAVKADLLPPGVDYTVADFAVNSGPSRAAKHLQAAVGVVQDGDIGPKTLAAVAKADPEDIIRAIHASRMRFLRGLKTWATFGKGWSRRVDDVLALSLKMLGDDPVGVVPRRVTKAPVAASPKTEGATPAPKNVKDFVQGLVTALALAVAALATNALPKALEFYHWLTPWN